MNIHRLPSLICLLALTGCKSFVYVPAPGAPTATLRVPEKIPFVYLTENADCPKKMVDQSKPLTVIPANVRLWIEPGYSTAGLAFGSECTVPLSFVPEAGREYSVLYRTSGRGCTANIIERDSDGNLTQNRTIRTEKSQTCLY